ncbi:hypothetical protein V6N12_036796 [Hibiscus sabdariffa]|uniref:Uncharacterized protein n=1 Tax=Hibiscus sabdariffa TaxID=183260 RepID=A0ABR2BV46_9ROSI
MVTSHYGSSFHFQKRHRRMLEFVFWSIQSVARGANVSADKLAKSGINRSCPLLWKHSEFGTIMISRKLRKDIGRKICLTPNKNKINYLRTMEKTSNSADKR